MVVFELHSEGEAGAKERRREEKVLCGEGMVWGDSGARRGAFKDCKVSEAEGPRAGREGPKTWSARMARPDPASRPRMPGGVAGSAGWLPPPGGVRGGDGVGQARGSACIWAGDGGSVQGLVLPTRLDG